MTENVCAIYCRLSREDEDKRGGESESIVNQRELLSGYAAAKGWSVHGVYSDDDASGADAERPGFLKLLRDAEDGRFSIVLCKTQSRFTRDIELVERYLHGLFPRWGVRFVTVVDCADTSDRQNKKSRQLNGLINEWYLEDLSENVRAVFDDKRRRGQFIGSFPPYGYAKSEGDKNRLTPDGETAPVVRRIFDMYEDGKSLREVAAALDAAGVPPPSERLGRIGRWNKNAIARILKSETYIGNLTQGRRRKPSYKSRLTVELPRSEWITVRGTHEGIVTPGQFRRVNERLLRRGRSDTSGSPSDGGR